MLADVLGKMCVSDALHGRVATVPLLILLNRFAEEQTVIDFVEQYAKLALTLFIKVEKKAHAVDESGMSSKSKDGLDSAEIRRTLILEIIAKIIHLNHQEYNDRIRTFLANTTAEYSAIFRSEHPGLRTLVTFLGADEDSHVENRRPSDGSQKGITTFVPVAVV